MSKPDRLIDKEQNKYYYSAALDAMAEGFEHQNKIGTFYFTFPWKPHPNQSMKIGRGGKPYADPKNKEEQGRLVQYFRKVYKNAPPPHEGNVVVNMLFCYPKPRRWFPGKNKGTPDLDNLIYTVNNAFKGVIWLDDDQYYSGIPWKGYWGESFPATILEVTYYEPVYSG